jgi:hypothetical protein
MNMVGHQAVGEYSDLMTFTIFSQPFQVKMPIIGCEKHVLPTIPALSNMVRHFRENSSR